jgi:hypothetical protein
MEIGGRPALAGALVARQSANFTPAQIHNKQYAILATDRHTTTAKVISNAACIVVQLSTARGIQANAAKVDFIYDVERA